LEGLDEGTIEKTFDITFKHLRDPQNNAIVSLKALKANGEYTVIPKQGNLKPVVSCSSFFFLSHFLFKHTFNNFSHFFLQLRSPQVRILL
jgi:hypothetical protein